MVNKQQRFDSIWPVHMIRRIFKRRQRATPQVKPIEIEYDYVVDNLC